MFIGIGSGAHLRNEATGKITPEGEDRRHHLTDFNRAEMKKPMARASLKSLLNALCKNRFELGSVSRWQ